jgi:hypothetical protein
LARRDGLSVDRGFSDQREGESTAHEQCAGRDEKGYVHAGDEGLFQSGDQCIQAGTGHGSGSRLSDSAPRGLLEDGRLEGSGQSKLIHEGTHISGEDVRNYGSEERDPEDAAHLPTGARRRRGHPRPLGRHAAHHGGRHGGHGDGHPETGQRHQRPHLCVGRARLDPREQQETQRIESQAQRHR